jgi:glutamate 5-kinase
MTRITVKIGSNVLTRPNGTLDVTRMSALVDQIAELHRQGVQILLVSSGAVASGRSELKGKVDGKLDTVSQRQLFSAVGQAKLINKYYELFRDHGISCGQILTTKENFSTRRHYLNQKNCMEVMLSEGVIPIINENDTISVSELMFTDNDELSGLIATMMNAGMLILLSNIDGIYTGNPADPTSHLIPIIDDDTDISQYIQTNRSSFGRGGMVTKHRIARKVAAEGIEVIIANGKSDNILPALVHINPETGLNEPDPHCRCTRFKADKRAMSGVKKWIAHSEDFSKGALTLNAGAVAAVTGNRAASILPVGVTAVEGDFEEDDIVRILTPEGHLLGVGKISTDSATARAQMGTKGQRPLVHYDYLWIE